MLKRQRPITPPPSSLGDPPSFLPNGPIRSLQPLHTVDTLEPRSKRQRTQPPSLDGALRGWLESGPAGPHGESDGEEDWIEEPLSELESPLLPSATASQYKDANNLLHELHVLNQHRLLFVHSPQDRHNLGLGLPLPTAHTHSQNALAGHRATAWTDGPSCQPTHPQFPGNGPAGQSCHVESGEEKGLVEEVQCVRERYEGVNRLLGSLFLSRRHKVEVTTSSAPGPSC